MTNRLFSQVFSVLVLVFSMEAFSSTAFSKLFVFGDSLSDTGNFASITSPLPPPFFNNRISNGPISIDVLAQRLGFSAEASLHLVGPTIGTNYSVVGARSNGDTPIDLLAQVSAFLANQGGSAPSDALYIVFIGGNDVRDARDASGRQSKKIIKNAVGGQLRQIKRLIQAGARNIVVFNVADIGRIPETRLTALATNNRRLVRRASRVTRIHNFILRIGLKLIRKRHQVNLVEFDFFSVFSNLLDTASDQGFTNSTEGCFSQLTLSFNASCNFGARFPEFVFFDEIHPTTRAHAIFGNIAADEISEAFKRHLIVK